jgi:hypothetical protein
MLHNYFPKTEPAMCPPDWRENAMGRWTEEIKERSKPMKQYDSDLSKVKAGDWVWTIRDGWVEVIEVLDCIEHGYPVLTDSHDFGGYRTYTAQGRFNSYDKHPSAFVTPPECFNPRPKPCQFKKGDRVLVRGSKGYGWRRRYFSHMNGDHFMCFTGGADEWSTAGDVIQWKYCKPWSEDDE